MIRIHKPTTPPAILLERGQQATEALRTAFDADPEPYLRGEVDFDSRIYGHESVKMALRQAQHDKCAFCESKFTHVGYGDVEHFRPKAGFAQQAGDALGRPGYYWLVYTWSNLFASCQLCNQRFKRNLFLLRKPGRRARSHHDDLTREEPLLLDPATDDVIKHLVFRDAKVHAVRRSRAARTTIDVLGLNRDELVAVRLEHLTSLLLFQRTRRFFLRLRSTSGLSANDDQLLADVSACLDAAIRDSSPYAAMARAALR